MPNNSSKAISSSGQSAIARGILPYSPKNQVIATRTLNLRILGTRGSENTRKIHSFKLSHLSCSSSPCSSSRHPFSQAVRPRLAWCTGSNHALTAKPPPGFVLTKPNWASTLAPNTRPPLSTNSTFLNPFFPSCNLHFIRPFCQFFILVVLSFPCYPALLHL
jgi:hypothetical protein